jgi:3-(3-hydroxy-phenyl)propionate hydroxylase
MADAVGRPLGQPTVAFSDGTIAGLDRALGGGWALVQLGDGAGADVRDGYWSRLDARRVRVFPAGTQVVPPSVRDHVVNVVETADTVVSLCAEAGSAGAGPLSLLVRPDRYVAAVITPGEQDRVIAGLRAYEAPPVIAREEDE